MECPKCGKKDSSDGERYCGKCEEEWNKEEVEFERFVKELYYKTYISKYGEDSW